jgi:hypothetical protein
MYGEGSATFCRQSIGQAAESSLDPRIPIFEFPSEMSASGIQALTIHRNRQYLTPELETLNADFE